MTLRVVHAVYGALREGRSDGTEAAVVTAALQRQLNSHDGVVRIDNDAMGVDPARGVQKHFAALVEVNGRRRPFACVERQTIDFYRRKPPADVGLAYRMGPFGLNSAGGSGTVRFRGTLLDDAGVNTLPEGATDFTVSTEWVGAPGSNFFVARTDAADLRLGRWRVTAESPPGTPRSSCEVALTEPGPNRRVNFQENVGGCARGFEFPG